MTKSEILELLKLLSAIESWGLAIKQPLPDYLDERLGEAIKALTVKVLEQT